MQTELKEFILDNFLLGKVNDIGNDTSLILSGMVDSFAALDIMQFITEKFGVKINEDQVSRADFDTINKIISTIERFKK